MSWGGEPRLPSAYLAGVGKGRLGRTRRVAILERYDGAAWCLVARFGRLADADRALDEAVGSGTSIDELRVVEASTGSNRLLLIVVYVLLG